MESQNAKQIHILQHNMDPLRIIIIIIIIVSKYKMCLILLT